MTPATDAQIRAACESRSATEASRYLTSEGYAASESRCNTIIARMIASGERKAMNRYAFPTSDPDRSDIKAFDSIMGCKRLLAAQLQAGAHWISDRGRMEAALREAGLV